MQPDGRIRLHHRRDARDRGRNHRPHRRVFRHLVITGRSRLALYLARIPAGLAILLPLVAVAFTMVLPGHQLRRASRSRPRRHQRRLDPGPPRRDSAAELDRRSIRNRRARLSPAGPGPAHRQWRRSASGPASPRHRDGLRRVHLRRDRPAEPGDQRDGQDRSLARARGRRRLHGRARARLAYRAANRARSLLIVLEIIVTPILAATIPYFLNGQRLVVGIALDQLRPGGTGAGQGGPAGPGPGPGALRWTRGARHSADAHLGDGHRDRRLDRGLVGDRRLADGHPRRLITAQPLFQSWEGIRPAQGLGRG